MARKKQEIYGGVDTHGRTHHAAAISGTGTVIADQDVPGDSGWLP